MEYKKILYTDLIVSSVCLGGAPFGSSIDPDKSMRLMDLFVELGGNFIDTANVYGKWLPDGRSASEETLGKWMKTRKNRGRLVVTTKGAHPDLKTMSVQRLSKEEISADVDDSLKNLQTDYIDLYWLHRDDPNRCVGEILERLRSVCHTQAVNRNDDKPEFGQSLIVPDLARTHPASEGLGSANGLRTRVICLNNGILPGRVEVGRPYDHSVDIGDSIARLC